MLKVPSAGGNHEIPKSPNFSLNVNNQLQLKSVPIVLVIGRPPRWRQTLSTDGFYLLGLSIQGIQCDFQELGIPFLMLLLKKSSLSLQFGVSANPGCFYVSFRCKWNK